MRKMAVFGAFLLIALAAQAHAGFEQGEAAYTRGDYSAAYREWMPLAVKGDARAQWGVAHLYLLGLGVRQNVKLGAEWAKKSADQGYVDALSLLAGMYERGVGVPKDIAMSIQLRKRAAATRDALAQYNLALAYLRGRGVQKDVDAAMALLKSAAQQNFQAAMLNVGVLYLKGEDVPLDLIRAYMWFELAAAWKSGPNGDKPFGSFAEIGERATSIKKMMNAQMTPAQIAESQRLAREWMAKSEKRKKKQR